LTSKMMKMQDGIEH